MIKVLTDSLIRYKKICKISLQIASEKNIFKNSYFRHLDAFLDVVNFAISIGIRSVYLLRNRFY